MSTAPRPTLALLSSQQIGVRFKEWTKRSRRRVVVVAIASVILIAGAGFGALAGYHALVEIYHFTLIEAAGIMAIALLLLGVLILASLHLLEATPKRQTAGTLNAPRGVAQVDQSLGKAMQGINLVTLVATAFGAGLLASRRAKMPRRKTEGGMPMKTTWKPYTEHGRLTTRSNLPESVFAFPAQRKEPLTDANHVRDALARFDQVEGVSDADRDVAFANIKKAAEHYGVEIHEKDWRELGK